MDQTSIEMTLAVVSDASFTWTIPDYSIEKDYSQIFEWNGTTMTVDLKREVFASYKSTKITSQFPKLSFKGVPPKSAFKILMTTKAEGVAFFVDYTAIKEGSTIDGSKQRFINNRIINNCYEVDGSVKINIDVAIKELKSEDPLAELVSNMGQLLADEKLADFRFIVEETELPVHKTILSVRIPAFDEMVKKAGELNQLPIKSAPLDAFKELLHFIYTGEDRNILRFARELLVVVTKFKLETLKARCEGRLMAELDYQNFGEMYNLAVRAGSMALKKEIARMTTSKLHSIAGKEMDHQLPPKDTAKVETFYRKFSELCAAEELLARETPKKRSSNKNRNQKSTQSGQESSRARTNSIENRAIAADIKTTRYVNGQVVAEVNHGHQAATQDGEKINISSEKSAVNGVGDEIEASAAGAENSAATADVKEGGDEPDDPSMTGTDGKPADPEEKPKEKPTNEKLVKFREFMQTISD